MAAREGTKCAVVTFVRWSTGIITFHAKVEAFCVLNTFGVATLFAVGFVRILIRGLMVSMKLLKMTRVAIVLCDICCES